MTGRTTPHGGGHHDAGPVRHGDDPASAVLEGPAARVAAAGAFAAGVLMAGTAVAALSVSS